MIKKDFKIVIGADIAKKKFDVACLLEGKFKHQAFANDAVGFACFAAWFSSLCGDSSPLICMEATGSYSLPLADYLVNQGCSVSLVNPAKIHAFAKSERQVVPKPIKRMPSSLPVTPSWCSHRCGYHHPPIFANYKL
ncbi:MAG: IS110 family transposase [Methylococcales bacterium]